MEILKVQNLCKTYGKGEAKVDALKNVSFSLISPNTESLPVNCYGRLYHKESLNTDDILDAA